ncbi:MAG: Do family serine endopeptidase [Hyphomicrobiales bacterium]|nr:Do family serine endopeptidase [Hyphomicrobiales bacterium]
MFVDSMLVARSRAVRTAAATLVFGAGLVAGSQSSSFAAGPESVADVASELLDSVVNISTSQTVAGSRNVPAPRLPDGSPFQEFFDEFFDQRPDAENDDDNNRRPRRVQSLGSGFVIDASGVIVTNNHVIDGADEITANFADGTRLKATLVGRDEKTDLAVLKVEPEKPLVSVSFGDSEGIRVGDWVMAIGNPFGLGGTVTVGIVSARNRDINSGPYDNFIQTDASINRGNSGGPLFNMEGEVVGINTAIISPTGGSIGIGFSVPSSTAVNVIKQLRDFGETRRGWLGVRIQEVTEEIAESLSMAEAVGALVAGVTDNGPAADAGILPGDVILQFDGRDVEAMNQLPRMVADQPVGKEVDVVVLRKGEEKSVKVTLGRLEEAEIVAAALSEETDEEPDEPPVVFGPLGLSLSDLSPTLRTRFKIDDKVSGVVVTDVAEGSAAEEKRVQPGDVILEISQEPVATPEAVEARVNELKTDGRKSALLLLANKDGDLRFVAVAIDAN